MTDITDRLRTWCQAPNAASAQDLMDEASVDIGRLRDALTSALDHRDLLAVKVSQWEASKPTLTDEEREAIETAIATLNAYSYPTLPAAAATLRKLLERLK